jgi:hypothetical protein
LVGVGFRGLKAPAPSVESNGKGKSKNSGKSKGKNNGKSKTKSKIFASGFRVSGFELAMLGVVGGTMTAKAVKKSVATKGESPSRLIDARIEELGDWRGKMLSHMRGLIQQADPEVVEEWKWRGVPVWYHDGMICTGETYKSVVKLTFAKGASLKDPSGLFNSSLEGNTRRAIDLREGDAIDEDAFKTLIRAAAALNKSSAR